MARSIQALREQKNDLSKQANHLLAEKGDQVWNKEDQTKFDGLANQIEGITNQIETTQRILDASAEANFTDAPVVDPGEPKNEVRNLYAKMLRNGRGSFTTEEHMKIHNAMSTTTDAEGGFTVQSEIASELIEPLKDFAGMRRVADQVSTSTGVEMKWPTSDGTNEEGEIVAQNTAAGSADIVFGTVALNVFKFGSKKIAIPLELLQDASVDIIGLINNRFNSRIGRIMNRTFTVGTGTGEPNGLVTASSVGKVGTTGQTVTVTYDDLIDLTEAIDIAHDDGNQKFMFSQSIRKVVRKIKDTQGRPIWTPSYDAGIADRSPDQLIGYDIELNNHMPAPAANAKSIAFGKLSSYLIRDVMQLTVFRFEDSVFIEKGQIGFLAWARSGGNLINPDGVSLYQHSAT